MSGRVLAQMKGNSSVHGLVAVEMDPNATLSLNNLIKKDRIVSSAPLLVNLLQKC